MSWMNWPSVAADLSRKQQVRKLRLLQYSVEIETANRRRFLFGDVVLCDSVFGDSHACFLQ